MSTQTIPTGPASEIVSYDPATGEQIGSVARGTGVQVREAVARARSAQKAWAALSFRERGAIILKARKIALEQVDEIAKLIARETGKPAPEAMSMEVVPGLDLMHYFARNAGDLLEPQPIDIAQYGLMGRSSQIVYKPLGVIGIISPWNFP